MEKPNNPLAFPSTDGNTFANEGMTLIDYFANSAMQGMIANPQIIRPNKLESQFMDFSKRAYRYADAMLKQREL